MRRDHEQPHRRANASSDFPVQLRRRNKHVTERIARDGDLVEFEQVDELEQGLRRVVELPARGEGHAAQFFDALGSEVDRLPDVTFENKKQEEALA